MNRIKIVNKIGDKYHISNTEKGEFSYVKALKSVGKNIKDYQKTSNETKHQFLDIRFENERLVILVECKNRFSKWNKEKILSQLQEYVRYEKNYSNKKIVAILAETEGNDIWVWYGQSVIIDDLHRATDETVLKTFEEYEDLCFGTINNKIKVVDSIKVLNEKLHSDGIDAKLRSQFVGTCLLALKNGLTYKDLKEGISPENGKTISPEKIIIKNMKDILEGLLTKSGSLNKAGKLAILNNKVLTSQDVTSLTYDELKEILEFIDDNVVPYINDKSTAGQDLLNLFFTTFNKYVGKLDKNQAFTPDHICDFMSKAVGVNKNSRVLDPCCGSGAFLVRAMTDAMDDCDTEEEREHVKQNQIFGIEYEEGAFGLSSTNMLIHGDGNSNVIQDSMFNKGKWIEENNINIVLMNPPYNATKKCCDPKYTRIWESNQTKDPSKGLHFVEWVARHLPSTCKMAVLLPMQAAIGSSRDIKDFKKKMLDKYTLDAVFSLPSEIFYPGASAVACCMIFDLSQRHERTDKETFFGYFKEDNFIKRKGLGRVEQTNSSGDSLWVQTEKLWLDLYKNRKEVPGLSVMHKIGYEDEWLAEAYMKTDFSVMSLQTFQQSINYYLSFLVKYAYVDLEPKFDKVLSTPNLDIENWQEISLSKIFNMERGCRLTQEDRESGSIPFVTAGYENYGVVSHISNPEQKTYSNAITIDMFGNSFYYEKEFKCDDNVLVLQSDKLNKYNALFISTVISIDKYKYSYGRQYRQKDYNNHIIKLPTKNNQPDWDFMENYIKSLPYADRI